MSEPRLYVVVGVDCADVTVKAVFRDELKATVRVSELEEEDCLWEWEVREVTEVDLERGLPPSVDGGPH